MKNLIEKYNNWYCDLTEGDEKYTAILRTANGIWWLLSKGQSSEIVSFMLLVDEGEGMCVDYSYSAGNVDIQPTDFSIIIKGDKKMIFSVNGEYGSFCIKDVKPVAKSMVLIVRTEKIQYWVFAHEQSEKVYVSYDTVVKENEAMTRCIDAIVANAQPKIAPVIPEVANGE